MEGVATAVLFAVNRSKVFCGPCKFPNMESNIGNDTQHGSSPVPEASPNKSNLSRGVEHGRSLRETHVPCDKSDEWKLKRPNDAKHT